ncbi:MAG: hypothetical protein FJZ96_13910 [Chloroflexi bacterium]|nr:hypothetical protein [Chloroflexota bacterium]
MNLARSGTMKETWRTGQTWLGSLGHLALLAWMMSMVLLAPVERILPAAGLCLFAALLLYPASFRRLLRGRTMLLLGMVLVASLLFGGASTGEQVAGLPSYQAGLISGMQMVLRAVVLLLAMDGFSASVQIPEVAGAVERMGLRGLGFSIGVAFNLLPNLRDAATNTWNSLRMRGGLRRRRLHSLRLMLVTILTNALRRGEEIALAAESRAYTPECSRLIPLRRGRLDLWLALPLLGILLLVLLPA